MITKLRWTADGQGILQPGYTHIFVVPATGGAPKQITSGDYNHAGAHSHGRKTASGFTPPPIASPTPNIRSKAATSTRFRWTTAR